MAEYKNTHGDKFDPTDIVFHEMMRKKLETLSNDISGYKLIDFASGIYSNDQYHASGFQGGIYYNESTGEYIVVCRGTEFNFSTVELYRDFIQTDVCSFGSDVIPKDFYETLKLLERTIDLAGDNHTKVHIVGHSLGGGIAQMLGAISNYSDIDVTTYNAVDVEHLLGDMKKSYTLQANAKNASNINNYATCNDFVSTIFNIIGNKIQLVEPKSKKQVLQSAAKWDIKNTDSSDEVYMKLLLSTEYAKNGHGIDNFIDDGVFNSFTPCDDLHVYKTVTDILKILKLDYATLTIGSIINALLKVSEFSSNNVKKIFKIGETTGGAANISESSLTLVVGVSVIDTPEEYDYVCQFLVDNDFSFVGKLIDSDGNITFYVDDAANSISALNEIVSKNQYFEI